MDATCGNSDSAGVGGGSGSGSSSSRRYGVQFTTSNYLQAPLFALLEYSGILRNSNPRSINPQSEPPSSSSMSTAPAVAAAPSDGEVAIRIIGTGDHDSLRVLETDPLLMNSAEESEGLVREGGEDREVTSSSSSSPPNSVVSPASGSGSNAEGEGQNEHSNGGRDSSYQRFDIQQVARWIEQVLPFSLLLLVVFIRQHLQGFFVTIWIAAVMFKSNDILRKQTALKV